MSNVDPRKEQYLWYITDYLYVASKVVRIRFQSFCQNTKCRLHTDMTPNKTGSHQLEALDYFQKNERQLFTDVEYSLTKTKSWYFVTDCINYPEYY